jgi:hypothetical protein
MTAPNRSALVRKCFYRVAVETPARRATMALAKYVVSGDIIE